MLIYSHAEIATIILLLLSYMNVLCCKFQISTIGVHSLAAVTVTERQSQ